ncbi:putative metal-dependent membrane protease [Streptococcus pneumoniae]|nr:putative metal-dependent membrane protease [Streptococcus pneumoniae]
MKRIIPVYIFQQVNVLLVSLYLLKFLCIGELTILEILYGAQNTVLRLWIELTKSAQNTVLRLQIELTKSAQNTVLRLQIELTKSVTTPTAK